MDFTHYALIAGFVILLISNFYLLNRYLKYKARYQVANSTFASPMRRVSLAEIDPVFTPNEFGVTLDTQVQYIGKGNLPVVGATSDTEAWVLAVLAKKAKKMFEFGTCTGKTTYLWALNSPDDAQIDTITLSPEQIEQYSKENVKDSNEMTETAKAESQFTRFLYSDTPVAYKVNQIFNDSKLLDENAYQGQMDLIFIDGSHAYSYVMSDSEKALKMVAPNGIILWHDYRGTREAPDVYHALNKLAEKIELVQISGTSLVAYINRKK
ncbi:MAG: class I SAM-dependent methyltransferase [Cytophagales bacterium]|nr:MAG: class I SAM-dependent methyltransferase [Cytophagales bacterium]